MQRHILTLVLIVMTASIAFAVPQQINYQGYLTATDGSPMDTTVAMTFKLYTDSTEGSLLWTEIRPSVTITDGLFDVRLGEFSAFEDQFNNPQVWLGITVGNNSEMTPRSRIISVGYAFRVGTVDGADGGAIFDDVNINGRANIGSGNTNSGSFAFVVGENNTASGNLSTVAGGDSNSAIGDYASVGGGHANDAIGYATTVGGGSSNLADSSYATVGGGYNNRATGFRATVGGGYYNTASNQYSTVGGGYNSTASGYGATVGGGGYNDATDFYATVGGGYDNFANNDYATVGGGQYNYATNDYTTVGGGYSSTASGSYGTIGGGRYNRARGVYSVVSGGGGSSLADSNSASGDYSAIGGGRSNITSYFYATVGGGYNNVASGDAATVGGGFNNVASGGDATIPGGYDNTAGGDYSFATGKRGRANHTGSFVWGSSASGTDSTVSFNDYTFTARCQGGARFYTGVTGTNMGVSLSAGGGGWNNLCDVRQKNLHGSVNTSDILHKISQLPLHRWSYKTQDESIQHVGPTAQDFYAAFQLGESDTTINTLDPDGIALAAIQELVKENHKLQTSNLKLGQEMAELRVAVQSLLADKQQSQR
jgi:hypothetical protein